MPGSSLWLLPPASHPLQSLLTSLIKETSERFASPHLFVPHVTLTSEIDPSVYGGVDQSQEWLDGLAFPKAGEVVVKLGNLDSEDVFVRKLYVRVEKEGVRGLGVVARRCVKGFEEEGEAERWARERYMPHLSLL
jgi:2',3'-cyclic-nucleotide 3'-phosphodiesterase